MNKVCLPVIAIALGIIAFCALKSTFGPTQDDMMKKYVGKKISFFVYGSESAGKGTLIDVNERNLTIEISSTGSSACYNREQIVFINAQL
ncbi:hypothetical protein N9Y63_04015 [Akkermansiaceae bacterium]|nr:hypothetical protein [Akkermansiaceae bacterium]